jgi:hypothetical protein
VREEVLYYVYAVEVQKNLSWAKKVFDDPSASPLSTQHFWSK